MDRITEREFDFTANFIRRDIDLTQALKKLQDYENLEEDGLLIRLPCKLGDEVYEIVDMITFNGIGKEIGKAKVINTWKFDLSMCEIINLIGKTWFLKLEDAEKAINQKKECL